MLYTANKEGKPNIAYFGSSAFMDDKTLSAGLMGGRTPRNLKENPNAVFSCVEGTPVTFSTPGCRLYLEVNEIHEQGELLDQITGKQLDGTIDMDSKNGTKFTINFNIKS